jgi:dipeptidyl aminopeptidase/acylaminoacyl peptidase
VTHLEFASPDGLPLEGWYISRADRQGAQPTVMFIHGGPYHATGNAFRFDFHLLAANGYAVLCANFRGSTGYGDPFARAIMGDWGARAFPDHMAAVDAAIARGYADPRRLGVWGHSHGGFATAWIVGHTERFRAAIIEAGVSNFATMYYLSDAPHLFVQDLGGRPDEIPDVYRSRSPLSYAARCRTPTLLIHGDDDLRCPMAEAEQFYRALHDHGCKTELVQIPGMNHMGDSTGPLPAREGQNEALLEWFERYL